MPDQLDLVERIERIISKPIMARLDAQDRVLQEIKADAGRNAEVAQKKWDDHEARIGDLERAKTKALWGFGFLTVVVTGAFNFAVFKFKTWVGWTDKGE